MVFTIEPALYFKDEDLSVPEEYRGIGIRLEDDVLCTEDGNVNLSAALPARLKRLKRGWRSSPGSLLVSQTKLPAAGTVLATGTFCCVRYLFDVER